MQQDMDIGARNAIILREMLAIRTAGNRTTQGKNRKRKQQPKHLKKLDKAAEGKQKSQLIASSQQPAISSQQPAVNSQQPCINYGNEGECWCTECSNRTLDIHKNLDHFRQFKAWPKSWDPVVIGGVQYYCFSEYKIIRGLFVPSDYKGPTPWQFSIKHAIEFEELV